jgi:DNA-3-methyladenine glycosylase I
VQDELGSLDAYLWAFVDGEPIVNRLAHAGASSRRDRTSSWTISKDLKRRGFRFVGTDIDLRLSCRRSAWSNDHTVDCFRYGQLTR